MFTSPFEFHFFELRKKDVFNPPTLVDEKKATTPQPNP
jgi:hypothetical protein